MYLTHRGMCDVGSTKEGGYKFGGASTSAAASGGFSFSSAGSAPAFSFGGAAPANGAFPPVQSIFGSSVPGAAFGGVMQPCPYNLGLKVAIKPLYRGEIAQMPAAAFGEVALVL